MSMDYKLVCTRCGHVEDDTRFRCGRCGSILEVKYKYAKPYRILKSKKGVARYQNLLPVRRLPSLGEGNTPLIKIKFDSNAEVLLKLEMNNPTKTFKDRGSVVELSKAAELGFKEVCCASTGNMGLSVAHYARRLGVKAAIFISRDADKEKISRIRKEKAKIMYVRGDFNKALDRAEEFARKNGLFLCGDYHFRKEGQKTIAYELAEQLRKDVPDYLFIPVGNGTLFSGVYKGLNELKMYRTIDRLPRIVAVQSELCNPVIRAYKANRKIAYVRPRTAADAIAVGYPTFGFETLNAIRNTNGYAIDVSEDEIRGAVKSLEGHGVYAELGGGTGYAGFLKMYNSKKSIFKGKRTVIVITGNNEDKEAK